LAQQVYAGEEIAWAKKQLIRNRVDHCLETAATEKATRRKPCGERIQNHLLRKGQTDVILEPLVIPNCRTRSLKVSRPPLPPFTDASAIQKVRMAEDAWNTRDPAGVALAYTTDSRWRNRSEFVEGRAAIEAFLTRKWSRELDYRLIKEVWAFRQNRIAVRFAYEWHDDSGNWFRSYGNENWEFDEHGLMRTRIASINDLPIKESERKYHWPLGRRPDGHPSLSDLGL
jgi:uncharacterized protein